jgi:iron complex outermembrane receptor protein
MQNAQTTTIKDGGQWYVITGSNCSCKGTTNGNVRLDGKYSIELQSENAILQFSFMGYIAIEVSVKGKL